MSESDTFMERLELAIDSLGSPDYFIFATYFAPELLQESQKVEQSPEMAARAEELWLRLGLRLFLPTPED